MSRLNLSVLSEEEVLKLHKNTLEVLDKTGVKIPHPETLEKCKYAGARVDEDTSTVRFPPELVEELRNLAPSVAKETGLNGKILNVGGENRYYTSLILDPWIADYSEGLRRPVLEDVRRNTIIGETLPNVDALMRMAYPVSDIPGKDSYFKTMEVFLSNTTKHVAAYPASIEDARNWMDITAVIADSSGLDVNSTALLSLAVAVTSPLQFFPLNIEILKMAVSRCYPVIPTVCPMAGTTSPYTVAGTALIANVETLLVTILTQLYKPGHPVFHAVGPSTTNMKTGEDLYYRAEKMLYKITGIQMGQFYNLPISGEAGGTLTHRADIQNGAESILYLLSSTAGGQNMIGGLGSLYNALGMSSEQIIMQSGLAAMAEYVSAGIDFSEEKLSGEAIHSVGPGGNFMMEDLTIELLRDKKEFFNNPYYDVAESGKPDSIGMYEAAHLKAEELVEGYKSTVPERVRFAIKDFFKTKYNNPSNSDR